jgi:hypothetical protein
MSNKMITQKKTHALYYKDGGGPKLEVESRVYDDGTKEIILNPDREFLIVDGEDVEWLLDKMHDCNS